MTWGILFRTVNFAREVTALMIICIHVAALLISDQVLTSNFLAVTESWHIWIAASVYLLICLAALGLTYKNWNMFALAVRRVGRDLRALKRR